jgi:hypothetical protein
MRQPKTLADFPHFIVSAVRRAAISEDGYTRYELDGRFDCSIEKIDPHWFWLLIGEEGCVCASLKSLDKETRSATVTCDERNEPQLVGATLAYLSAYWQAFNVWMVLDPNWGWKKRQFQGADAVAADYEANDISIVEGREVKIWTKLEPLEGGGGQSRHYPAAVQTGPLHSESRIIPSGWGHQHCDLCKAHIDAGDFGYCDPGGRWMCEKCYEKYVTRRDLAFVDEV